MVINDVEQSASPPLVPMMVTVPGPEHHLFRGALAPADVPVVSQYVISAACPVCGVTRGAPTLEVVFDADSGHLYCVDVWFNPCGHHDSYENVLLEALTQCARFGCPGCASISDYPYCSELCAGVDGGAVSWGSTPAACASMESLSGPAKAGL